MTALSATFAFFRIPPGLKKRENWCVGAYQTKSASGMFHIYKHNKHPEYRLIAPTNDLPVEIREEWTLIDVTDRVEAEKEEEIAKCGYHVSVQRT
ncbi:MAG TPA: hypothetical protein VF014_09785 [Casimicrobiaceae bacterium]|nr:hypothetical protein [Casimicrobiaceae bacterium]